ncbi:MAG: hypothetical protein J7K75_12355 [Desulfuromonas sp.]|nr:hypothetical protein [Desulfuromonas sp.]
MTTNSISAQLEKSLLLSIDYYQVVLQSLLQISQSLTSTDSAFKEMVQKMNVQQTQAQQHDEELIVLLRKANPAVVDHPLYVKRTALITEILELNHLLLPKINGMMALISHELSGLKNGRIVLGGYKQVERKQGRIVKSSA